MEILYAIGILVVLVFIWGKLNRTTGGRVPTRGAHSAHDGTSEADVERLVSTGRKIDAIKLYREIHEVGLKEAKEAVDELAQRLDRGQKRE